MFTHPVLPAPTRGIGAVLAHTVLTRTLGHREVCLAHELAVHPQTAPLWMPIPIIYHRECSWKIGKYSEGSFHSHSFWQFRAIMFINCFHYSMYVFMIVFLFKIVKYIYISYTYTHKQWWLALNSFRGLLQQITPCFEKLRDLQSIPAFQAK